jgi:hypothetical protein
VAGFVGFSIRQYAIVAILTLVVGAFWHRSDLGNRRFFLIVGSCFATVVIAVFFYQWRMGLPGFDDPPLRAPTSELVSKGIGLSFRSATLVGFLASPAIFLVGPVRLLTDAFCRSKKTTIISATAVVLAFTFWTVTSRNAGVSLLLGPGNYFRPAGILGTSVIAGVRPDLLPMPLMTMFAFIGFASSIILLIASTSPLPSFFRSLKNGERGGVPAQTFAVVAVIGFSLASAGPVFLGMPFLIDISLSCWA